MKREDLINWTGIKTTNSPEKLDNLKQKNKVFQLLTLNVI